MLGHGVLPAAALALLEELPILEDALIGGTVGALIRATLAYRRQRQGAEVETAWLTVRWTWVGVCLTLVGHIGFEVVLGS